MTSFYVYLFTYSAIVATPYNLRAIVVCRTHITRPSKVMRIRGEEETSRMWSNIIIFEVTDKRILFIRKFYRNDELFLEVKREKIYVCLRNSLTIQKF